ncbi:MAG: MATE family efflux transporter [Ignavibacteriae bacterium]|nr:MATE family efflux transporter [Ignavibacteriota bacterium]
MRELKHIDYKYHFKETIKLAVPVSIGQLGHIMLGVVDSFMVGRLGAEELAASSLANGLFFLILVLGIGMSFAITALIAIAKGEENNEKCGVIVRQALLVNLVFSVILTILTYSAAQLVGYLNQEPEVAILTQSYLEILSISILPFMLFQTYRQFLEGLSFTKPPMYMAIIANFVNIFGNWVFIFGNIGMPAYGLDGAGYATLITRTFMGLGMMFYVLKSLKFKQYDPTLKFKSVNFKVIKKIISVGFPSGLMFSMEVGAFALAAIIIGWFGSKQLAAHQIAINLASISYMVVLGISAASTIRVGNYFGKKNMHDVKAAGNSGLLLSVTFMTFTGILFVVLNRFLPSLYIGDMEVIEVASGLLIIAALFQLSDGIQAVGIGILRGLTDVKIPMYITFVSYWIIGIPVSLFLAFSFDMEAMGVWIGLLLGLTIAAVLFVIRFRIKMRIPEDS